MGTSQSLETSDRSHPHPSMDFPPVSRENPPRLSPEIFVRKHERFYTTWSSLCSGLRRRSNFETSGLPRLNMRRSV